MSARFMVSLGNTLDAEVERLAKEAGITKSEVVRHAMRFYLPLETARAQGITILVVHPDGTTETLKPQSIHGSKIPSQTEENQNPATETIKKPRTK